MVRIGEFCVHAYKIRFCKKTLYFPLPQNRFILEIVQNIRGSCAAMHDDRFTNFTFS